VDAVVVDRRDEQRRPADRLPRLGPRLAATNI